MNNMNAAIKSIDKACDKLRAEINVATMNDREYKIADLILQLEELQLDIYDIDANKPL